jgi:hypothetical protein
MPENVLEGERRGALVPARRHSEASGQTGHLYTEARYAAATRVHARRVVIKCEAVRLPGPWTCSGYVEER